MAIIRGHEATIGVVVGSAWGTGVQATNKLRVRNFTINDSLDIIQTQSHDEGYLSKTLDTGRRTVRVSGETDLTYGGEWLLLYAFFAGTASAPAEQTGAEGDYLHNLDIATDHDEFCTLAYEIESDVVGEISSFKLDSITISGAENGPGTVSFSGIGDVNIVTSGATTNAQLNALTYNQTEEMAVFNGANAYFRLGTVAAGALDADDDQDLVNFSVSLNRPLTPLYALRGASTDQTLEPFQSGLTSGQLTFSYAVIDDGSNVDLAAALIAKADMMCEIFVDGAAINSGVNASYKLQFPRLLINSISGYGVSGQATQQQPGAVCTLGTAAAAPAGMTGVTNLMRLVSIDANSTQYVS